MSGLAQDVEVRLAEIDRRLREIQAGLVPGRTPRDTRAQAPRPSAAAPEPERESEHEPAPSAPERRRAPHPSLGVRTLSSAPGRAGPLADALASARRHRGEYSAPRRGDPLPPRPPLAGLPAELQSSLLAATRDLLDGYERAASSAASGRALQVSLSAGPFSSTDALRAFEHALARIPGVHDVAVRGYEGPDHAILEVRLEGATPPEPSA